jgi:hypothetical protein
MDCKWEMAVAPGGTVHRDSGVTAGEVRGKWRVSRVEASLKALGRTYALVATGGTAFLSWRTVVQGVFVYMLRACVPLV